MGCTTSTYALRTANLQDNFLIYSLENESLTAANSIFVNQPMSYTDQYQLLQRNGGGNGSSMAPHPTGFIFECVAGFQADEFYLVVFRKTFDTGINNVLTLSLNEQYNATTTFNDENPFTGLIPEGESVTNWSYIIIKPSTKNIGQVFTNISNTNKFLSISLIPASYIIGYQFFSSIPKTSIIIGNTFTEANISGDVGATDASHRDIKVGCDCKAMGFLYSGEGTLFNLQFVAHDNEDLNNVVIYTPTIAASDLDLSSTGLELASDDFTTFTNAQFVAAGTLTRGDTFLIPATSTAFSSFVAPCFHESTIVDIVGKGAILMKHCKPGDCILIDGVHTPIVRITKGETNRLVQIKPHAISRNVPNKQLLVTRTHLIKLPNGQSIQAQELINNTSINSIEL